MADQPDTGEDPLGFWDLSEPKPGGDGEENEFFTPPTVARSAKHSEVDAFSMTPLNEESTPLSTPLQSPPVTPQSAPKGTSPRFSDSSDKKHFKRNLSFGETANVLTRTVSWEQKAHEMAERARERAASTESVPELVRTPSRDVDLERRRTQVPPALPS